MATADPPEPPSDDERAVPAEEADAAALPPLSEPPTASRPAIRVVPPAATPPLEDAVAGLIDEKPARPHLTVVPSPDGPTGSGAGSSSGVPRRSALDDDPLAVVLGSRPEEPEAVSDAWAKRNPPSADHVDVAKLLDINAISGGLRQIASWIEKQIPSLNAAVGKFISSLEVAITKVAPDALDPRPAEATDRDAAAAPPLTVVPAEPASEREPDPEPSGPIPASRPWIDPTTERAPGEPQSEHEPEPPPPAPEPVTDPAADRDGEPADPDDEPELPATD